jgi:glycine/D-amino acid oxidase-like deaminating enzyme
MNLKSGRLFWPTQNEPFQEVLCLQGDIQCDVAVIGGGLTGSLIARALGHDGVNTVLLDKRGVASGSTSASTALIQYEIDVPLFRLIQRRGRDAAVRSYRLCRRAIEQIEQAVWELREPCRFARRPSLYLARTRAEAAALQREFRARIECGFEVQYLDRRELESRFSFSAPAALLSADAAEIDPHRFTQALLREAVTQGLRVFAPATVCEIDQARDRVTLKTHSGSRVFARKLIVAAGYESTEFLRCKLVQLRSSYVLTTQPVPHFRGWRDRCLIWEAGHPYHYVRTTHDHRIMIGGGDENFVDARKRDALIGRKARQLQGKLEQMFPDMEIEPAMAWAGTFGDTKDGLPYIDTLPSARNVLFALCYGANGTNFAMIGANLARDWVREKNNSDAVLFAFDR